MSSSHEETKKETKTDPRILTQFQDIISSVQEELNKGKLEHISVAEPRLNGITKGEATQKYIEDKEKYRDRLFTGAKVSLAQGWESLFRS